MEHIHEISYRYWSSTTPPFVPQMKDGNIKIRTNNNTYQMAINLNEEEALDLIKIMVEKIEKLKQSKIFILLPYKYLWR